MIAGRRKGGFGRVARCDKAAISLASCRSRSSLLVKSRAILVSFCQSALLVSFCQRRDGSHCVALAKTKGRKWGRACDSVKDVSARVKDCFFPCPQTHSSNWIRMAAL